jgi:hypothetical protein
MGWPVGDQPKTFFLSIVPGSGSAAVFHNVQLSSIAPKRHILMKTMTKELQSPPGYTAFLKEIKKRIHSAQVRASFAVS